MSIKRNQHLGLNWRYGTNPKSLTKRIFIDALCVHLLIAALAFNFLGILASAASYWPDQSGVWRYRGLGGKCLDVGGYPLGYSSPVIIYDCNGTAAQDITAVPFGSEQTGFQYELRAHGRCLGVGELETQTTTPFARTSDVHRSYQAGMPIVLSPCNGSNSQRFSLELGWPGPDWSGRIYPSEAHGSLLLTVLGSNSANRTPVVLGTNTGTLEPAQKWTPSKYDTTPYEWTPAVATVGSYAFKGFGGKCMDVGGTSHPEHSPAFLYGCNGTLAQFFYLRRVNEDPGYYNITAFGSCLDVAGGVARAGAPIELNACSGINSQRFAFDNFDRQFIYPAGTPEVVIGVRGADLANRTPLELQSRAAVDHQNWIPISVEMQESGLPKAPAIRFSKLLRNDSGNGPPNSFFVPAIEVREGPTAGTTAAVLWKPLGGGDYNIQPLFGNTSAAIIYQNNRKVGGVYVAKVRNTLPSGVISESPEILIDGRSPEAPVIWTENVQPTEVTLVWTSVGTPRASYFIINYSRQNPYYNRSMHVEAKPGTGLSNVTYRQTLTDLQPNTKYSLDVQSIGDLFWGSGSSIDVMTLPQPMDRGPHTTPVSMNLVRDNVDVYLAYAGTFGPIYDTGAIITNINFPTQFPAVALVKPGYSTSDCGNPNAIVWVHGDMSSSQKVAVWGIANLSLSGLQTLKFVGCIATPEIVPYWLPLNVTWQRP